MTCKLSSDGLNFFSKTTFLASSSSCAIPDDMVMKEARDHPNKYIGILR